MAKKPVRHVEQEELEKQVDEVVEQTVEPVDDLTHEWEPELYQPDPEPVVPRAPVAMQTTTFALPRAVLIALIDHTHGLADAEGALRLGLLGSGGTLTKIGQLVIDGTDRTALGHKMAAEWRKQHNAGLKR